jgi:hypothetical protein
VAALTEAYETALRLGLRGEMWNAAYSLTGTALEFENLELAETWVPILSELDQHATVDALRAVDLGYALARFEYMRADFERARYHLERIKSFGKALPSNRAEQSILALDVLLHLKCGTRIPPSTLRRVLRSQVSPDGFGVRDFETAAVAASLQHVGEEDEAVRVYDRYIAARRSRTTPHSALRAVKVALGLARTEIMTPS